MKKGFTLIELLAVIVILAIIALIATPIIINIINDSQEQSVKSSANLYVDGLSKFIMTRNMLGEFNPTSCTISNGNISCDGTSIDYTVNGDKPTSGTINFSNGIISGYTMCIMNYRVIKSGASVSATKDSNCENLSVAFNGTKVVAGNNDTHKGIVYLDPTNLSNSCTAQDAVSTHGTKTGCMKFYIYDEDATNYKLILDHNTSDNVAWISYSDYIAADGLENDWNSWKYTTKGPITAINQLQTDTTGWVGNPDLIEADEIAHIIGADSNDTIKWSQEKTFGSEDIDTESGGIYLDGSGTTYSDYDGWKAQVADSSNKSNYAWLYDNTTDCVFYGCNAEISVTETINGYWTKSSVVGDLSDAWEVSYNGYLGLGTANNGGACGIRPVITLSKTIIDG